MSDKPALDQATLERVIEALRDCPIGDCSLESVKRRGTTHRGLTHNAAKEIAQSVARSLSPQAGGEAMPEAYRQAQAEVRSGWPRDFDEPATPAPSPAGVPDGWQPIETAPKDGTFILLYVPNAQLETGPITIGAYMPPIEDRDERGRFKKGEFVPANWSGWLGTDADFSPSWCEPSHWMSLPPAPGTSTAVAETMDENSCPGHVASERDPKVCARCGVHIDSLRPDDGE